MPSVCKVTSKRKGRGFLNKLIDKLPVELHIPIGLNKTFQFCGPGTKLAKRLARGERGINPLDEACREHDISYSLFKDDESRRMADKELATKAFKRLHAKDASIGEKIAAAGVGGAMKLKSKLGMGLKKRNGHKSKKKKVTGKGLNKKYKRFKKKRMLPIAKTGGFLPFLLPILGALGALGGGAAGIAKAVQDSKANQKQLEEQKRHNMVMEQATKGKGLYLKPYKGFGYSQPQKGKGLYLKPHSKNFQ